MIGHEFRALGIEAYYFRDAQVDLREIVLVEVSALHEVASLDNVLRREFLFCAKHVPRRVERLVLRGEVLVLFGIGGREFVYVLVQRSDALVKFGNLDVLGFELRAQFCDFLRLFFELGIEACRHFLYGALHLGIGLVAVAQLLLQVGNQFAIEA